LVGASVAVLLIATAAANAGGLAVREQSVYGQGTSFAGIAAGGDLSAMFWNPAVMTQFAGIQSSLSASGIFPYTAHTPTGANNTWPLVGTNNVGNAALVPSGYFSYQISPSVWLGLSVNSPFGLSESFPEVWAGRDFAANNNNLTTYNAAPSIAYRINDWISVGAGVQIQYARVSFNHNSTIFIPIVPPFPFALGDTNLSGTGWGYGFTAGVTLAPSPTTSIGLGYRSRIDQKISGSISNPVLGSAGASTTVKLPDMVSLGIRQRIDPRWTLLGTVEWTNWSRAGTSVISAPAAPIPAGDARLTVPFQWKDGWLFSIGAEYLATDRLTLRTGFGYEISPVTDSVRSPLIPDNDRFWASIGASWQIWRGLTADLAYSHIFVRNTHIDISAASGNPWFAASGGVIYIGDVQSHVDLLSVGIKYRWDTPAAPPRLITK
jgi:long-chain fatty acid transport protein